MFPPVFTDSVWPYLLWSPVIVQSRNIQSLRYMFHNVRFLQRIPGMSQGLKFPLTTIVLTVFEASNKRLICWNRSPNARLTRCQASNECITGRNVSNHRSHRDAKVSNER